MAEESVYSSGLDSANNKRKFDNQTAPPPPSTGRRATGFSAPIASHAPDSGQPIPSYNSTPYNNTISADDEIQIAKQRAQEIAARLFNNAEPKRPRVENGATGFDSNDNKGYSSGLSDYGQKPMYNAAAPVPTSYGYPSPAKKIDIPNGRVGVIIGKGGETIKYLQLQSGAKIQVTRDMDADPSSHMRAVELMGTSEQIAKAEQLIKEVLAEAESGGSGVVSRRVAGQPGGSDQFSMKVPNTKVGLVIGKGGETIKTMQATTGARIQVIPLHLPPGDMSTERTVQIEGTNEQIEAAKQLVNEVISENRVRNPMGGGYQQQGYQATPQTNWGQQQQQQPGYGYGQPGSYPGQQQYNTSQQQYGIYPPQQQSGSGYNSWDPSSTTQQTTPGGSTGYDYYGQQQQQQTPAATSTATSTTTAAAAATAAASDNTSTPAYGGYGQQGYSQNQGYYQEGYGYQQSGYGQPQQGYDSQQGYNSAAGYGNVSNQTSDDQNQGYSAPQNPSPNPNPSYPGYGSQQPASSYAPAYGTPAAPKAPAGQPAYGQPPPQQSPTAAQAGYGQAGYGQPPAAAQTGYGQPDTTAAQRAPGYGAGPGQGYGPGPTGYGSQQGYGGGQQYGGAYGGGYAQPPPAYSGDGGEAAPPAPQGASAAAAPPGGVAKTSPQS